jgi:hypothetical protein
LFEKNWEQRLILNIKKNLNYILEKFYDNNQAHMAKDMAIRPNTLFTYLNTDTKPPITFIYKLCTKHNLSLDMFLNDEFSVDMDKTKKREAAKRFYSRYAGSYYTYFLVVDSYSLKEGLIQEGCININESGVLIYEIFNAGKRFSGSLSASEELIYFDLKSSTEKVNITIKNPGKNISERYLGGMGIINISSPEDNRIPCAQKIIISSIRIPVDKYYGTLSEYLRINTFFKIKKRLLNDLLEGVYGIERNHVGLLQELIDDNKISMEDKVFIGEREFLQLQRALDKESFLSFIKYILQNGNNGDIIHFNSLKVGIDEDKMIYRFIKNEFTQPPAISTGNEEAIIKS